MRICHDCKTAKNENEYYKGSKSYCKDCSKARTNKFRLENPDKWRAIRHRTINKNKEKISKYYKEWYSKNGRYRDSKKTNAHALVKKAVKEGVLHRPKLCSKCNETGRIEGHHKDYYKPLEVEWLCNRCHRIIHTGA